MWGTALRDRYRSDRGPSPTRFRTGSYVLHAEKWNADVLSRLVPPGYFLLEFTAPPPADVAIEVVEAYSHAEKAFREARYDDVARVLYKALEAMSKMGEALEDRYGGYASRLIAARAKELKSLCKPVRFAAVQRQSPLRSGLGTPRHGGHGISHWGRLPRRASRPPSMMERSDMRKSSALLFRDPKSRDERGSSTSSSSARKDFEVADSARSRPPLLTSRLREAIGGTDCARYASDIATARRALR